MPNDLHQLHCQRQAYMDQVIKNNERVLKKIPLKNLKSPMEQEYEKYNQRQLKNIFYGVLSLPKKL